MSGEGLKQITFPDQGKQYTDFNPQWSPDGGRVALDSDRGETREADPKRKLRQIFLCDSKGEGLRRISTGKGWYDNEQPAWCPDGNRLAWVTNRNGSADIILASAEGEELRWLAVTAKLREFYPSWSSDGASIVYMAQEEWTRTSPPLCIYAREATIKGKGQKPRVLVTHPFWFGMIGVCSPTDKVVGFVSRALPSLTPPRDLWTIRLDGTQMRRITELRRLGLEADPFVRPTWSPKGDFIAFVAPSHRKLPPGVFEDGIWICTVADGSVQEVPLPPATDMNQR